MGVLMIREERITKALTIFYQHRQIKPPEGHCTCGVTVPLGDHFLAHVFAEIFQSMLAQVWQEGRDSIRDELFFDRPETPNPYGEVST